MRPRHAIGLCPGIFIVESDLSRNGIEYEVANGESIANLGDVGASGGKDAGYDNDGDDARLCADKELKAPGSGVQQEHGDSGHGARLGFGLALKQGGLGQAAEHCSQHGGPPGGDK